MKTTVLYHVVGSDDVSSKQEVNFYGVNLATSGSGYKF